MDSYSLIFLVVVGAVLVLKLALNRLQAMTIKANMGQVPAMFTGQISLEAHQKAASYNISKLNFNVIQEIFDSVFLVLFTLGGGIQLINDTVMKFIDLNTLTFGVIVIAVYSLTTTIINIPFSYISTFCIETKYGFNKTTLPVFIIDLIKGLFVGAIILLPLIYLILWLMNVMGSSWWLWVFITMVTFNLLIMMIYPVFIAPIFNKFQPLDDKELVIKIDALLKATGFKSKGVFVMDGSKRSSHGNAYFTGIGSSKRIVFFDTLIKQLNHEQIIAVLAHELGHFKHKHIVKQIIMSFAILFIGLFGASFLINEPSFYSALGVSTPSTANGLILLMMVFGLIQLPFAPLMSYMSRKNEFEADSFAAKYASSKDLIDGLLNLYRDNASTLTPNRLYVKFYYSHPPANERITALEART